MNIEWAQTTIYFLAPLFCMLLFIETIDDDDGPPDGGMLHTSLCIKPNVNNQTHLIDRSKSHCLYTE